MENHALFAFLYSAWLKVDINTSSKKDGRELLATTVLRKTVMPFDTGGYRLPSYQVLAAQSQGSSETSSGLLKSTSLDLQQQYGIYGYHIVVFIVLVLFYWLMSVFIAISPPQPKLPTVEQIA